MTASDILKKISHLGGYHSVLIPEFTWGGLRIDALFIDLRDRWCRGIEIKVNRGDFQNDNKWTLYTKFCSSLTIACPNGLIKPEEVEKPFGLLWVYEKPSLSGRELEWVKRPKNFQKRNSLAWVWTYLKVMEQEFPRMFMELERLKADNEYLKRRYDELWKEWKKGGD
jgi:hypothetical protein